ncbi:MAG: DUF2125 domain-containing protein [Sulfitobacter sp.]
MRRLIWLICFIALAWGAWWAAASYGMQRSALAWLEARRSFGWQAELGEISRGGFPSQLTLDLRDLALADPYTGLATQLPQIDIATPIYWPGYATVTVPAQPIILSTPSSQVTLTADDAVAKLRLHPGAALQLEDMALTTGPWTLNAPATPLLAAQDMRLAMTQDTGQPDLYHLDLNIDALTPGTLPRSLLRLPDDWPRAFDSFAAQMTVQFDRPWDRSALEQRRPQPRVIKLRRADAKWADLHLLMAADLTVDAQGRGTGKLSLKADNWPAMLDMAQDAGLLPPRLRDQAEGLMRNFAKLSGNRDALDITLSLKDGQMSLGFIPLGQAPRFTLP